ncbi:hypothetical protein WR25_24905 [Diploscapter pachys]|uniref:Uncharacterized protein n=1 Tax=Diploscapter pachys TaxID=2018661 RepID=A0A2A2M6F1_9BILA|nr:hypothetical protein WR25_24905 [Diploscapter pachys]
MARPPTATRSAGRTLPPPRQQRKGDTDIPVAVSGATASYPLRAGYFIPDTSGINAGNISTEIVVTAAYD